MVTAAAFFIVISLSIIGLVYAKSLMIPFIFALLFWFLTREIRALLDNIDWIRKYLPTWIKNSLVFGIMILVLFSLSDLLTSNIQALIASYETYQPNVTRLLAEIGNTLNIDVQHSINAATQDFDFGAILGSALNGLTGFLGNFFMIVIYALFVFLEESTFRPKLQKVFTSAEQEATINEILAKIQVSVSSYLRLKTMVSCLTGVFSFIVLSLVGVEAPLFWAFLIFLLNYIPTIGSLIATIFPALFSLIQFGAFGPFLIVLVSVGLVQVVVGNIIEPRVMGDSLNLSPLVTIIALSLWGQIWGITGMILSVPITVIMVIVFSQFPKTRTIAILLSANGEIDAIARPKPLASTEDTTATPE